MKEVTIKMSEKELAEVNKVLGALGKKIVPEEFKKSKKVNIEPEEPFNYTDEGPTVAEINSGGCVFIHSSYFEDANIDEDSDPHMYANKTNIYLTDLRKDEIDWQGEEVEYWGTTARNLAGDLPLDLDGVWECINPYGDTCTISVSDHIIKIHYTGDGVNEDEEEEKFPPKEFVVTTDAEGRATIRKEIFEAANLLAFVDTWCLFKNDSGTKLYITWKDDPYLNFDGEEATGIKDIDRFRKTALRIKLGEPYTNYKVTTTGEEDKEVITIHLDSGVTEDDDDLTFEEEEREFNKRREAEEQEELKKKAEELVYQIFGDVEKIKAISGVDLTNIITKVVKAILSGKKVF